MSASHGTKETPCSRPSGHARWHRDDEARFDEAVRPYLPQAVRAAKRFVQSDDLAWDAMQEALWALWNAREKPANLAAWLARATRHRAMHMRRSRWRMLQHERRASRLEGSCGEDPLRACQRCELLRDFQDALSQLPQEQRAVFQLCELEECDYQQAAALLGIPVGTIRSRLSRARATLRQSLSSVGIGPARFLVSEEFSGLEGTNSRVSALLS